ncbi:MAG TPA: hypothetical protein VJQ56_09715 [Blastocatellia bacterium]|nr:hypothetical protein [Blastocatellia bacterium]
MQASTDVYGKVLLFLRSHSAHQIPHVNSNLLSHLEGTYELLREWGSPAQLCLAGLCHAVYGTYGFELRLLDISQRSQLRDLIGAGAEEIVYFYASCDRQYLYPQIGRRSGLWFRDRFNGAEFVPDGPLFESFLELTFANELELVRADAFSIEQTRDTLGELFKRCEGLVSRAAFGYFTNLYGLSEPERI